MSALYERRAKKDSPGKLSPSLTGQALKGQCMSGCSCRGTLDKKISSEAAVLNSLTIQSPSVLGNDSKNL